MTLKRVFTFLWMAFVAVLLCATTIAGLFDVSDNIAIVDTGLKKLTLVFQVLYTVSGAAAVVGLVTHRPWRSWPLGIWAAAVTLTATLAPPAWGDTGIGPALAAGAATAFVTGMIVWWTDRIVSGRT
jgi:hypothetical protein